MSRTFPADQAKSWEIPYVEDARKREEDKTNALNRSSKWRYEPPEPEEDILPPTAEEIDAIRQAAREEGLAEGKAEGYKEGLEQGKTEGHAEGLEAGQQQGQEQAYEEAKQTLDEQLSLWQSLNQQLANPLQQIEGELQNELVRLAVQLARAVIGTEIKTNQDVIFAALSAGLKVLPVAQQQYQIHMHPDDIELLKQHFSAEEIEKHNWQLIEAPQLSRGGCDISTNDNGVDISVERRTRDVLDKFLLEQGLAQIDSNDES